MQQDPVGTGGIVMERESNKDRNQWANYSTVIQDKEKVIWSREVAVIMEKKSKNYTTEENCTCMAEESQK